MRIQPLRVTVTAISSMMLLALITYIFLPARGGSSLDGLRYPAESAGRMIDRHLEFYEGYSDVPGLERLLHESLFGSRERTETEAIEVYREVLAYLQDHPDETTPWALLNTQSRFLVTLAEVGQRNELLQVLARMDASPEEAAITEAVRFAYGLESDVVFTPIVQTGVHLLPLGWAADRLRMRVAMRLDDAPASSYRRRLLRQRGERWRDRVLFLSGLIGCVVLGGLVFLVRDYGGSGSARPWRAVALERPWRLFDGFSVIVYAALSGLLIVTLLSQFPQPYFRPGILGLWSTLFASLPMLWLIHRYLLKPAGSTYSGAFGLTLRGVWPGELARITLAVLSLEWAGTLLISWGSWKLGLESHWSQGLSERMIFGPWETTLLGGIGMVLWASVFEEIGFRGLVYVTLRSHLRPVTAMIASAALFSSLHVYSLPACLSVFWSGLVLAWAFERFRSLLPAMIVHACGNLLSLSIVLMFYR